MALAADLDVAIVGAGICGLAAARGLHAAGRSVRIFDARPRAGGRILSSPIPGGHADLGPTWFWPGESRILALVSEFDLAIHDQFSDGDALFVASGEVHRVNGFSVPTAFRFSNGAQSLTDALARALPAGTIVLDSPVERVERVKREAGPLRIHTATGSVTAAAVVLALPPSVAIARGIIDRTTLEPAVGDVARLTPVWMGGVTKTVAVYQRAFWRDRGLSGMVSAPGGLFAEIHDMSGPDGSPAMLFGFGHAAGAGTPTAETFVQQLVAVFGPDAASPSALLGLDWSAEPFTSVASGNSPPRYDLYGSPLLRKPSWDGRLHWASTESGAVAPGHLEGALEAAERTVRLLTAE